MSDVSTKGKWLFTFRTYIMAISIAMVCVGILSAYDLYRSETSWDRFCAFTTFLFGSLGLPMGFKAWRRERTPTLKNVVSMFLVLVVWCAGIYGLSLATAFDTTWDHPLIGGQTRPQKGDSWEIWVTMGLAIVTYLAAAYALTNNYWTKTEIGKRAKQKDEFVFVDTAPSPATVTSETVETKSTSATTVESSSPPATVTPEATETKSTTAPAVESSSPEAPEPKKASKLLDRVVHHDPVYSSR